MASAAYPSSLSLSESAFSPQTVIFTSTIGPLLHWLFFPLICGHDESNWRVMINFMWSIATRYVLSDSLYDKFVKCFFSSPLTLSLISNFFHIFCCCCHQYDEVRKILGHLLRQHVRACCVWERFSLLILWRRFHTIALMRSLFFESDHFFWVFSCKRC